MKKEELYDTIEGIDEKFIDEAETVSIKKKSSKWIQWVLSPSDVCRTSKGFLITTPAG